jgi:hypothetical protein
LGPLIDSRGIIHRLRAWMALQMRRIPRPAMPRTVSLGTSRTVHRSILYEDAHPRTRPASREMPAVRCLADGRRPERGLAVDPSPHLSMSKVPCPRGVFRRRGWKARSGYGGKRSESVGTKWLGAAQKRLAPLAHEQEDGCCPIPQRTSSPARKGDLSHPKIVLGYCLPTYPPPPLVGRWPQPRPLLP